MNQSTILTEETTLAPAGITDEDWAEITSCVNELLGNYRIRGVDEDPVLSGTGMHQEIVFLRSPSEIGMGAGTTAITPFSCGTIIGTAFVFTDREGTRQSNREICELAVNVVGRMAGIEHVVDCQDVFSNDQTCGDRSVTNDELQCGRFTPETCVCGGDTINPYQQMTEAYGLCED
jgi:hypothetical protein